MEENKTIPINIWDDYWEDDNIPEGEIQETYIYVEDHEMSLEDRKKYLEFILDYVNKHIKLPGVKMWLELYESIKKYPQFVGTELECMLFDRWEIKIQHLSHEKRFYLGIALERAKLKCDGMEFRVYSES